jgi:hypothetical protein
MTYDSTGKEIQVGNRVRFRGQIYTIKGFRPGEGLLGTSAIEFEESPQHTPEVADEISVDLVSV